MSPVTRSLVWLLALTASAHSADRPRDLTIKFHHHSDLRPLVLNQLGWNRPDKHRISVTRLDYLLSEIALRKPDGSWMESRDWHAYISVEAERTTATLNAVPPGRYSAMRFRVGLDPKTNNSDPARYPPRHPLNPQLNNLHWNWQDGYVFIAIEGRYHKIDKKFKQVGPLQGYTFHLGNNENSRKVEIEMDLDTRIHSTVELAMTCRPLLKGIDFARHGNSTHSRPGDPIAAMMRENLTSGTNRNQVFSLLQTTSDSFQAIPPLKPEKIPSFASPFRFRISKRLPRVEFPADNPITHKGVRLGKRLFNEKNLSADGTVSCASCHDQRQAFTDHNRRFSQGVRAQQGTRNSMPLFNLAWHQDFFWDGRAKSLREQVLQPIEHPREMGAKLDDVVKRLGEQDGYANRFKLAFGDRKVTADRIARALEQYLLTLISQDSKFDLATRGEAMLTEQEKRGLRLFITEHDPKRNLFGADCFHCHGGNLFSNHRYFDNGLDLHPKDPGRMKVTGRESDRGKFKTPSLRNVEVTAPYMHDGRFATLEEVVC